MATLKGSAYNRIMLSPSRELEFLKFLDTLGQYLGSTRDPRKALTFALREGRTFFQAESGCVAVAEAGQPDARLLIALDRQCEHRPEKQRHDRHCDEETMPHGANSIPSAAPSFSSTKRLR